MTMTEEITRKYRHCPCRECGKREHGCHAKCPEYNGWCNEEEMIKQRRREENEKYSISNTKRKWLDRYMKRKGK